MADSLEQQLFQFRQAVKPFLALAKLDNVIDTLLGFIQQEKELKDGIASLKDQKAGLEKIISEMTASHDAKIKAILQDVQKAEQDRATRIANIDSTRHAAEEDAHQKIADAHKVAEGASAKKAALEKDYDNAVATMKIKFTAEKEATKKKLQAEIDDIKAERDALVAELASLKGRIAAA